MDAETNNIAKENVKPSLKVCERLCRRCQWRRLSTAETSAIAIFVRGSAFGSEGRTNERQEQLHLAKSGGAT